MRRVSEADGRVIALVYDGPGDRTLQSADAFLLGARGDVENHRRPRYLPIPGWWQGLLALQL